MKAFFRWLLKIVGSALTIILVIVLFPYISRIAEKLLPDESGAAIKASAILSSKLQNVARLETLHVEEDGVLNYDIQAALIGSVANINIQYKYEASFGVDLKRVTMKVSGNEITFFLPAPELLQDSLTPSKVYRDDFWYPGFSDDDYTRLLENERNARRSEYLSGEKQEQLRIATAEAFEQTISTWMKEIKGNLDFRYETAAAPVEN